MALKILKYGDKDGIGAVVEETTGFGKVKTWSVMPFTSDDERLNQLTKKWVCRETGEHRYASVGADEINGFYMVNFTTQDFKS